MRQKTLKINRGEIHLIPFPFTDLSDSKLRPCIIIGHDRDDITVVFVTSIKPKEAPYIEVKPTKMNHLKTVSYIRYTKIATLDTHMSLGQTGVLESITYKSLIQAIRNFIT